MYRDDEVERHSSDDHADYDDNEDLKFKEYHSGGYHFDQNYGHSSDASSDDHKSDYKQCPYTKMSCPMMQNQSPMMQLPHMCPMMGTDSSDFSMQPYMHRQGGHQNRPQYHHFHKHGYGNDYNHGYYPSYDGGMYPYLNPYYFNYYPWFLINGRED